MSVPQPPEFVRIRPREQSVVGASPDGRLGEASDQLSRFVFNGVVERSFDTDEERADYLDTLFVVDEIAHAESIVGFSRRWACSIGRYWNETLRGFLDAVVVRNLEDGNSEPYKRMYRLPTELTVRTSLVPSYVSNDFTLAQINHDLPVSIDITRWLPQQAFIDEPRRAVVVIAVDKEFNFLVYSFEPDEFLGDRASGDNLVFENEVLMNEEVVEFRLRWATFGREISDTEFATEIGVGMRYAGIEEVGRALWIPVRQLEDNDQLFYGMVEMNLDTGRFRHDLVPFIVPHMFDIPPDSRLLLCTAHSRFDLRTYMVFGKVAGYAPARYWAIPMPLDGQYFSPDGSDPFRSFFVPAMTNFEIQVTRILEQSETHPRPMMVAIDHRNVLVAAFKFRPKVFVSAPDGNEIVILLNDPDRPNHFYLPHLLLCNFGHEISTLEFFSTDVLIDDEGIVERAFSVSRGIMNLDAWSYRVPSTAPVGQPSVRMLSNTTRRSMRLMIAASMFELGSDLLRALPVELLNYGILPFIENEFRVDEIPVAGYRKW